MTTVPAGNLISACEVPGYAMMIRSAESGQTRSSSALIIAVEIGPISMSTFTNHNYNYMQFRTSFSGVEIVSVSIGAAPEDYTAPARPLPK
jgi:hypothetical protein